MSKEPSNREMAQEAIAALAVGLAEGYAPTPKQVIEEAARRLEADPQITARFYLYLALGDLTGITTDEFRKGLEHIASSDDTSSL